MSSGFGDMEETRPIWITGAGGLIGSHLVAGSARHAPGALVRPLVRSELDLADFAAVRHLFHKESPAAVIHCAALSRSPVCQRNPALARLLNVEVTRHLAELCADIPFIFFSSDLVFDGATGNYDEAAPVNPLSVYAQTKVQAEEIVLRHPNQTVIRTSLNAGISPTGDRAFNEELVRAWRRGECLKLFVDEYRCPIPAAVTARAVWELLRRGSAGLFHLAGSERLSRWEIGRVVARASPGLEARIEPGTIKDYKGAPRPRDTSLNCGRVQRLLSFRLPGLSRWAEGLAHAGNCA